jgi:hypothetical protein
LSSAFAAYLIAMAPFIQQTPRPGAIELADCKRFRNIVYNLTLQVLPHPKEWVSGSETVFRR